MVVLGGQLPAQFFGECLDGAGRRFGRRCGTACCKFVLLMLN